MLPVDPSAFFAQFEDDCSREQSARDAAVQEAADTEAQTPVALSLPAGETWYVRRAPEPATFTRWRTSLKKEGATTRTWFLLLAAYDDGWTLTSKNGAPLPSPAAMKSLRSWNRVPMPAVEAIVSWVAAEAAGHLNAELEA